MAVAAAAAESADAGLPATGDELSSGPLVVIAVGGVACALPQAAVRALLPLPHLDAPPGLPAPLAGFLNLGGTAVPVVDLARLLGLPPGEPHPYRHLVLLHGNRALLVDRAADVLPPGQPIRPVEPGRSLNGLNTGVLEVGDDAVHLLDPTRLLLAEEAATLDDLARQARLRTARWAATPAP